MYKSNQVIIFADDMAIIARKEDELNKITKGLIIIKLCK